MKNFNEIVNLFISTNKLKDGRRPYHMINEQSLRPGDDSGYDLFTLNENQTEDNHNELAELAKLLKETLLQHFYTLHNEETHTVLNDGLRHIELNEYGDTLTFNISDHHIHIIISYSGQY